MSRPFAAYVPKSLYFTTENNYNKITVRYNFVTKVMVYKIAEYFHIQLNKKCINVLFCIIHTKRVPFLIHAM